MGEIKDKTWDKSFEETILKRWKKSKKFKFNKNSEKKIYSIDTPPPYVNTPIHIGHATTYTIMDMIARYRRQKGYEVLFPLGLDRNGLPIETAAERKFKVSLMDLPRKEGVEYCKKILEESSEESIDSFFKLGISFNSWEKGNEPGNIYYTDSEEYRILTQSTFIDLWKKGLIVKAQRVNNYCPGCRTTIADSEVEYRNIESTFNHIIFKCKETGEDLIIATTRPELICSVQMIIFNPEDERYKHLNGKTAILPLYEREVPIKAHPQAKLEKGTGLVMMASFGDLSDVRFFREQNLEPIIAISVDGRMNKKAGFLEGLTVKEAREKIVEMLKEKGLLVKQENILHRTPICERSGDEIEFIGMDEFYLKQLDFLDELKKNARKMNFYDPSSKQILDNWISSLTTDWPISRRRIYATEVPVWYCKKCGETIVPEEKGKYYQPWKDNPPIEKCPKCGSTEFVGDGRVFDTWFDSSISPLYILKYNSDKEFFNKTYPASLRPQGKEIVRTWLYYTLLRCYQLTGKPPFKDVWIHHHILDPKGRKMSKSLGNVIDPHDILKKYGAEPFRLWSAIEGNLDKGDFSCSYDRIEGASKTINKLWNVARFVSILSKNINESINPQFTELDKWIMKEINEIVKLADVCYMKYDFHNPAVKTKNFLWEIFASNYIEMIKSRAYNRDNQFSKEEQQGSLVALNYVLQRILSVFYPIIPIVTTKLYLELYNVEPADLEFPQYESFKSIFSTKEILELNSKVWKFKNENNIKLKDPIKKLVINKKFKHIEKDIKAIHHPESIEYSNNEKVVIEGIL